MHLLDLPPELQRSCICFSLDALLRDRFDLLNENIKEIETLLSNAVALWNVDPKACTSLYSSMFTIHVTSALCKAVKLPTGGVCRAFQAQRNQAVRLLPRACFALMQHLETEGTRFSYAPAPLAMLRGVLGVSCPTCIIPRPPRSELEMAWYASAEWREFEYAFSALVAAYYSAKTRQKKAWAKEQNIATHSQKYRQELGFAPRCTPNVNAKKRAFKAAWKHVTKDHVRLATGFLPPWLELDEKCDPLQDVSPFATQEYGF